MNQHLKWFIVIIIIIGFIAIGYSRDFIMVNLNYHLDFIKSQKETSYAHSFFDFLNSFSFRQLYYGKYLLTLVFTILNLALSIAIIKIIFNDWKLIRIILMLYLTVFIAAAILFVAGFAFHAAEQGYLFSRDLMGFLQSPLPCAILLLGYPLYQQIKA